MRNHIDCYWGKSGKDTSWHPAAFHSLDVAACMVELLRRRPGLSSSMAAFLGVPSEKLEPFLIWLVSLHDIGKFSPRFQAKRPDIVALTTGKTVELQEGYAHADGSMVVWNRLAPDFLKALLPGSNTVSITATTILFRAVAGHHGRPVQPSAWAGGQFGQVRNDISIFVSELASIFSPTLPSFTSEAARNASWLMSGITVLADWLGSNRQWFAYASDTGTLDLSLAAYWSDVAVPKARLALEQSGLCSLPCRNDVTMADLFPLIPDPTPLQQSVQRIDLSCEPGIFLIEDLTGAGKTEAALLLARRMIGLGYADGVYMAMPTSATSNGMYRRLAGIPGDAPPLFGKFFAPAPRPSLVLAHGMRSLNKAFTDSVLGSGSDMGEEYAGEEQTASAACSSWIADMARKALLAHFGVGTIDQALLAVLPNKYQSVRIAGLTRKVVILDEIHCYDTYMTAEICGLLEFLGMLRCPVIALSATLPIALRRMFLKAYRRGANWTSNTSPESVSYPLITALGKSGPDGAVTLTEKSVGFRSGAGAAYEVRMESDIDLIVDYLGKGTQDGCACWIRNTVDDAREAVALLKCRYPNLDVMLFHSRYCAGDRQAMEDQVLTYFGKDSTPATRKGRILVATQVVEQSLDLDFDLMVSDLAPIDALIQRAGRLHRHERGSRMFDKVLYIYGPDPDKVAGPGWYSDFLPIASYVYPLHAKLWLTAKFLCGTKTLDLRSHARDLIENVYGVQAEDHAPSTLIERDARHKVKSIKEGVMGDQAILKRVDGYNRSAGKWESDIRTPTRLSDPDFTVRLAVRLGPDIVPWCSDGEPYQQWIRSTLNLPGRWLDAIYVQPEDQVAIDHIRSKWPPYERVMPVVVLTDNAMCAFTGFKGEKKVEVQYSAAYGAARS